MTQTSYLMTKEVYMCHTFKTHNVQDKSQIKGQTSFELTMHNTTQL